MTKGFQPSLLPPNPLIFRSWNIFYEATILKKNFIPWLFFALKHNKMANSEELKWLSVAQDRKHDVRFS